MTKRLIDIDDRLLESAQLALGASTYKETVAWALERSVSERGMPSDETAQTLAAFSRATIDLGDPTIMDAAWK